MTEAYAPEGHAKEEPDRLTLRVKPRPVARINRKVLITVCGTGLLFLFGAVMVALAPPKLTRDGNEARELHNVSHKSRPEGLDVLPRHYSDIPRPPVDLGAPLPGDLGGAVVRTEADVGLTAPASVKPFRPNAEDDALRAERIRQARLDAQARESGVLFTLRSKNAAGSGEEGVSASQADLTAVSLLHRAAQHAYPGTDLEDDQNRHGHKRAFLDSPRDRDIYNAHALQEPRSPYQVMAGTVIAASLVTGINSDLPGRVIAQVTENVYDSVSGRYLLIPQGSRLLGAYDSVVAYGQSRALIVWQRLILPDGSSIEVENLPATDAAGYAGLKDAVDHHTGRLIRGIALSTLLGVGTEFTFGRDESDIVAAIRGSAQDNANRAGQRITERNLNIQPTITIRPGWPLRVIVQKDLMLRPYELRGEMP